MDQKNVRVDDEKEIRTLVVDGIKVLYLDKENLNFRSSLVDIEVTPEEIDFEGVENVNYLYAPDQKILVIQNIIIDAPENIKDEKVFDYKDKDIIVPAIYDIFDKVLIVIIKLGSTVPV